MSAHGDWQPEKVRSKLTHPVIDGDGHWNGFFRAANRHARSCSPPSRIVAGPFIKRQAGSDHIRTALRAGRGNRALNSRFSGCCICSGFAAKSRALVS